MINLVGCICGKLGEVKVDTWMTFGHWYWYYYHLAVLYVYFGHLASRLVCFFRNKTHVKVELSTIDSIFCFLP